VIRYSYDHENRLVRRRMDANGDGDYEQKRVFAYDGNQVVLDFQHSGAGNVAASDLRWRYLWGPAVDQILAEEEVDGGTADLVQWTLTDHLNTVRDIAKYDPGTDTTTVVNHLVYDAFGRVTSESNPAVDSLFLFTARPLDADTGLQNNLNRWYDAAVGRWLSEDPIRFAAADDNLYRYADNRPTTARDSGGTTTLIPIIGPREGRWVDTGIKFCDAPLHGYIMLSDGVGYGFYAESHIVGGAGIGDDLATLAWVNGVVANDDAIVYKDATCKSILVNACCWDARCYTSKVEEWVRQDYATYNLGTRNRRKYNVVFNNCYTWRNRAAGMYGESGIYGPDLSECRTGGFWSCLWAGLGIRLSAASGGLLAR